MPIERERELPNPRTIIRDRLAVVEQGARHYEVTVKDYQRFAERAREQGLNEDARLFDRLSAAVQTIADNDRGAYAAALRGEPSEGPQVEAAVLLLDAFLAGYRGRKDAHQAAVQVLERALKTFQALEAKRPATLMEVLAPPTPVRDSAR